MLTLTTETFQDCKSLEDVVGRLIDLVSVLKCVKEIDFGDAGLRLHQEVLIQTDAGDLACKG